ncbi:MAG: hypothetical protein ABL958_15930 [Bdellovibrionia bacterium]
MSDDSLFSRHMRLIESDESKWSADDRKEHERLKGLRLPPLELKPTRWMLWKTQIQAGLGVAVMASLAIVIGYSMNKDEVLTAKGALQVNVVYVRDGKQSGLTGESELKDGDKIAASVVSAEEAIAYWTITDDKMNVLDDAADIESTVIRLEPGLMKSFENSFVLIPPNQGENLVVVVCPKPAAGAGKKAVQELFNRETVSQLLTESRVRSSDCVFVGYRLRRLP